MKTGLDHLPAPKREQIAAIAALLQAGAPIDMIILFGSYARGDWVDHPITHDVSDFDILVIVPTDAIEGDTMLWGRLEAQAREIAGRVPVSLLVHTIQHVNAEIRTGQYFFADIVNEGILLFNSSRVTLATPKALNASEHLALAERSFVYWFEGASGFFKGSIYYAAQRMQAHAAFLLHQAAERYFHAALLVFTGYKPKTHDLEELANQTAPLHPVLAGALPRSEPEDNRLFKLLKRAYIDARYSRRYWVTEKDFDVLREIVRELGARVRKACEEKLASFCGTEAVGELPLTPTEQGPMDVPDLLPLETALIVERWHEQKRELMNLIAAAEERSLAEGMRSALRRVLARRNLALRPEDSARIDACTDPAVLERWIEESTVAASAEEALR